MWIIKQETQVQLSIWVFSSLNRQMTCWTTRGSLVQLNSNTCWSNINEVQLLKGFVLLKLQVFVMFYEQRVRHSLPEELSPALQRWGTWNLTFVHTHFIIGMCLSLRFKFDCEAKHIKFILEQMNWRWSPPIASILSEQSLGYPVNQLPFSRERPACQQPMAIVRLPCTPVPSPQNRKVTKIIRVALPQGALTDSSLTLGKDPL